MARLDRVAREMNPYLMLVALGLFGFYLTSCVALRSGTPAPVRPWTGLAIAAPASPGARLDRLWSAELYGTVP